MDEEETMQGGRPRGRAIAVNFLFCVEESAGEACVNGLQFLVIQRWWFRVSSGSFVEQLATGVQVVLFAGSIYQLGKLLNFLALVTLYAAHGFLEEFRNGSSEEYASIK